MSELDKDTVKNEINIYHKNIRMVFGIKNKRSKINS